VITLLLTACLPYAEDLGPTGDTGSVDTGVVDTSTPTSIEADDAAVRALTDLPEGDAPCAAPRLARVDFTVDGDTFYGTYEDDGSQAHIRIIGVNTPEVSHEGEPADCYGNEAWTYSAAELEGYLVWLTFDADCTDDYGRTLAYAFRGAGDDGFFNRRLARLGYADELTIAPNDTFAADIREDVAAAQAQDLGLWGACGG
jgi:micrococcal nuclease